MALGSARRARRSSAKARASRRRCARRHCLVRLVNIAPMQTSCAARATSPARVQLFPQARARIRPPAPTCRCDHQHLRRVRCSGSNVDIDARIGDGVVRVRPIRRMVPLRSHSIAQARPDLSQDHGSHQSDRAGLLRVRHEHHRPARLGAAAISAIKCPPEEKCGELCTSPNGGPQLTCSEI